MPTATMFQPDGKPILHPDGTPMTHTRENEHRAFLTAIKSWWPTGRLLKRRMHPKWSEPPEGAEIHMDGLPWRRFERVGLDAAGAVTRDPKALVKTELRWVDIGPRVEAAEEERHLEAMRVKLQAEQEERVRLATPVIAEGEALMGGSSLGGGGSPRNGGRRTG